MIAATLFFLGALAVGWLTAKAETDEARNSHLTHTLLLLALGYLAWILEAVR